MILLVGGEKGGTGKTTIATNLAVEFLDAGRDTLLIDADPQGSSNLWSMVRDKTEYTYVPCVQKLGKGISDEVKHQASKYQDLIIDTGGRDAIELRASLLVADVLLIPLQPSHFDLWTLTNVSNLVETATALNPKMRTLLVLNRVPSHYSSQEAAEIKDLLSEFPNITQLNVQLHDRVAYRKAGKLGLGVTEYSQPDQKAINEIKALFQAVLSSK